jgi:hypothetical protein
LKSPGFYFFPFSEFEGKRHWSVFPQIVSKLKEDTMASNDDDDQKPPAVEDEDATPTAVAQKKKRLCRFPGCQRVIKSQGHCQRHGAKAKRCRVEGKCSKRNQVFFYRIVSLKDRGG